MHFGNTLLSRETRRHLVLKFNALGHMDSKKRNNKVVIVFFMTKYFGQITGID